MALGMALVAIGVLAVMFVSLLNGGKTRSSAMGIADWSSDRAPPPPQAITISPVVSEDTGGLELRIPLSEIPPSKARFFSFASSDHGLIRFFIVVDADKTAKVFLDACNGCFAARQGFVQQNDSMVCRKCGFSLPIVELHASDHECRPVRVDAASDGATLTIQVKTLDASTDTLSRR